MLEGFTPCAFSSQVKVLPSPRSRPLTSTPVAPANNVPPPRSAASLAPSGADPRFARTDRFGGEPDPGRRRLGRRAAKEARKGRVVKQIFQRKKGRGEASSDVLRSNQTASMFRSRAAFGGLRGSQRASLCLWRRHLEEDGVGKWEVEPPEIPLDSATLIPYISLLYKHSPVRTRDQDI